MEVFLRFWEFGDFRERDGYLGYPITHKPTLAGSCRLPRADVPRRIKCRVLSSPTRFSPGITSPAISATQQPIFQPNKIYYLSTIYHHINNPTNNQNNNPQTQNLTIFSHQFLGLNRDYSGVLRDRFGAKSWTIPGLFRGHQDRR